MRIHKGANYTTFSATNGGNEMVLDARRVFHPTRGEETQLEVRLVRKVKGGRHGVVTRKMEASANMTPDEAKEFAGVLLGGFRPTAPVGSTFEKIHSGKLQAYTPRKHPGELKPEERKLVNESFGAGWDARDAIKLPADVDREKIAVSCAASIIASVPTPEGMTKEQHKARIVDAIMVELSKASL